MQIGRAVRWYTKAQLIVLVAFQLAEKGSSTVSRALQAVDIRRRLGPNLRRLHEAKGWSQEAFAPEARIHAFTSATSNGTRVARQSPSLRS